MAVLTATEVEARLATGLDSDVLTALIADDEDWLANDPVVGIGQLTGSRVQTIVVAAGDLRPLHIQRPTAAVSVVDGGVTLTSAQVVLTGAARIERLDGGWRGPEVAVTYTPTDSASVRRALFDLIRITVTASPYNQESTEGHSYTRPKEIATLRDAVARSLDPHRGPTSTRVGTGRVTS